MSINVLLDIVKEKAKMYKASIFIWLIVISVVLLAFILGGHLLPMYLPELITGLLLGVLITYNLIHHYLT